MKMDSPLRLTVGTQWGTQPLLVTADSEGLVRIMYSNFKTNESGYAELSYEEWRFLNNTLFNREFLQIEVIDPEGFCNETCSVLY